MGASEFYVVLLRAHREIVDDPRYSVEGLESAACGPNVKHLAQFAIAAAATGVTEERWRSSIIDEGGPGAAPLVEQAEECMRSAGLWPWH